MVPFAIMQDCAQAAGGLGAAINEVQREAPGGDAIEGAAMQQLNAGEQIRRYLALAAPSRGPERVEKIVAAPS